MFTRKSFLIISVIISISTALSMSLKEKKANLSEAVATVSKMYVNEMETFDSSLKAYPKYFYDSSYERRVLKYNELIVQFKVAECLFTYLHPKLAYESFLRPFQFQTRDSGGVLPDNWLFNGPIGIEPDSILKRFRPQDSARTKRIINRSVNVFRKIIGESNYTRDIEFLSESDVFEALRLQIIRISTQGLANADFGIIEETGIPSLQAQLSSWAEIVNIFLDQLPGSQIELQKNFKGKLNNAIAIVAKAQNFKDLNRMQFLTDYLIPLSHYLSDLQKTLQIDYKNNFTATRPDAKDIYAADAFNPDFFAPGEDAYLTREKAELGKFLFFDPVLSDNNKRACASCHKPSLAFTDGNKKSINFEMGDLPRNAPTVINAAFQKVQFWDLRASSMEDQLDSVINNKEELHSSFENVIDRINSSKEYRKLFHAAFPETKKKGIQRKHVKIAIACYERTLTGLNSRFDQYMRGDKTKLNDDEVNGFNLFMGKARCGTCHFAPLFNGALPPYFEITDHKALGVPVKDTMVKFELDPDTGASKTFKNPLFTFSFKTPTVRNIELTAPYMHNGVYKTLLQVVNFYNEAAGHQFTKDVRPSMRYPFFPLLPIKLNLTEKEKNDLIVFLKALTDTSSIKNVPTRLPELGKKYASLNNRKLGGEY